MADCVFCKIIAGRIPCTKVYEDERCLAFLDIGPLAPGHTLLVPKTHCEALPDLPPDEAAYLGRQVARLSKAVQEAVGAEGLNVLLNNGAVAGQEVPHVHIHLIPRRSGDGLGYRWRAKPATAEVLKQQADAIRAHLGA